MQQLYREPTILSDKVVSLLPQLTFEDERTRAKERYEQQAKELKKDSRQGSNAAAKKPAAPKRKESAEEREYKARELLIKEDEDERRKFTIILASLGKMRKIEGMLYVYNMLKSRERQEDERIRQALDEAASR
jgi:pentatricopeptide repeat protein